MKWIAAQTKWIMLISGVLTSMLFIYAISPNDSVRSGFGVPLDGALANLIVRSWGMMIGIFGVMLIYAAFKPALQRFVLAIVGLEKAGIVILLLTVGRVFLNQQMGLAVYVDGLEVLLFAACLLGMQRVVTGQQTGALPVS